MKTTEQEKKDPVCGMEVNPEGALTADRGGLTYYFCSEKCRKAFESDRFKMPPHGGKKPDSCCGS